MSVGDLKVGDRVLLTDEAWGDMRYTVQEITHSGEEVRKLFPEEPERAIGGFKDAATGWETPWLVFAEGEWSAEKVDTSRDSLRPITDEEFAEAGTSAFEENVRRILEDVADLLVEKNRAYGNSALDPINVFSKASREEQLRVRLDDKLNRVAKGHEYGGEDTLRDILGYIVLLLIERETA